MNLERIFKPKSAAVFGVSSTKLDSLANVIFKKLKNRYDVNAYAINPRGGDVQGDKLYTGISEIPETIDLAVVLVRSDLVPSVIEECISLNVGGAVVISGGFGEIGNSELQDRVAEIAKAAEFPIIGPNCIGIFSPGNVDTLFTPPERSIQPESGNIAVVSQSGAFMVDLLVKFARFNIGVSHCVSIGNKAVIREVDLIKFLDQDPNTKAIAFYIEGFEKDEGREFAQLARECKKPIVVMKAGKTKAGSKVVSSHTASIAGDYRVFSDIMEQHGIIEVQSEYELLSYCKVFSYYRRHIVGNVGIITIAGGHGAIATDLCDAKGMKVPQIPAEIQDTLREKLSRGIQIVASLSNPLDMTGSVVEEDFVTAYQELNRLPQFDAFLLLVLPYNSNVEATIGTRMSDPLKKQVKPLIAYVPYETKYQMMIDGFETNNIPVADSVEGAVLMLDGLRRNWKC